ncbi:hypothetical protein [Paenibacillus wynnii]|uniref:WYL domain-containing protein n=1 Tax=Paenibacillus wynnii TaxID=268407 RepID=A0A098M9M3_9BACL|nr:hypothetical protein [Paenibacillus wynnii]KGE18232.1 hypothetical protein PWYN_27265 [Paenibacillus wynnii]
MKMHVGQRVEIVYVDKVGKITQRQIEIKSLRDGMLRATCLSSGTPRVFRIDNILAWQPTKVKHAG